MLAAPLVFLVGATATGKSELAVAAASQLVKAGHPVEIISADSVQIYRELVIGSARPSETELAVVPHHLIGTVSVVDDFTAADFARDAISIIQRSPQTTFFVVGGSGFYLQALMRGLYPIEKADPVVRAELEARARSEGLAALHRELELKDAETAAKIAPQDRYRIIRALEIHAQLPKGETLSRIRREFEISSAGRLAALFPGRQFVSFGLRLERARLAARVTHRVELMLRQGLIAEVEGLRTYWTRPALQTVGYREVVAYLQGAMPLVELAPAIVQSTLRLAKKQRTWFQRDDATQWFDALTERESVVQKLAEFGVCGGT